MLNSRETTPSKEEEEKNRNPPFNSFAFPTADPHLPGLRAAYESRSTSKIKLRLGRAALILYQNTSHERSIKTYTVSIGECIGNAHTHVYALVYIWFSHSAHVYLLYIPYARVIVKYAGAEITWRIERRERRGARVQISRLLPPSLPLSPGENDFSVDGV